MIIKYKFASIRSTFAQIRVKIFGSRRRAALLAGILVILVLSPAVYFTLRQPKTTQAATLSLATDGSSYTITVTGQYEAVMITNDTDDYLVFDDFAQGTNPTHEFKSPCILEASSTFCLRDDNRRITTILENTPTRVKIRVEGKFNNETGTDYLDTDVGTADLNVRIDYTFTPEGVFVENETDFQGGITLDSDSGHNGYEWLAVYADVTETAFNDSAVIYYGDGNTESSTSTDLAEFEDSNKYVVLPGNGTDTYQDAFIGIHRAGWLDENIFSNIDEWHWDINETGTQDLIAAQEQNDYIFGAHYAHWFFLLKAEDNLSTEAEREAYINDFLNPDYLTYTTGSDWFNNPLGSPGLEFDGSNDWVDMGNQDLLDFGDTDDFTIEFWLAADDYTGIEAIVGKRQGDVSGQIGYLVGLDGNDLFFEVSDGNDEYSIRGSIYGFGLNAWHHYAVVFDQDNATNTTIYWDGAVAEVSSSGNLGLVGSLANADSFRFGADSTNSANYNGSLDEVRVWNVARTQQQIQDNMYQPLTGSESNLVAYWRLNEATGQTAHDQTANNIDGTLGSTAGSDANDPVWVKGYVPDHFNEAEGTYTMTIEPALQNQVEFDLDAGTNVSNSLNVASTDGTNAITLTASDNFASQGIAYLDYDKISYTANNTATEVLSNIPATGDNRVEDHASGTIIALMNRHHPFFKLRNWRSLSLPGVVTLEGDVLDTALQYNASVKPVTTAYFADELTWYSTLHSETAAESPNIGTGDSSGSNSVTYTAGRYGNGAEFNGSTSYLYFPTTNNIDISGDSAAIIEFWMQPDWDSTDTTTHRAMTAGSQSGSNLDDFGLYFCGGGFICPSVLGISDGDLIFLADDDNSIQSMVRITGSNYSWAAGDWVHIRIQWDDTLSTDDMRVFINGVEPTHTHTNEGSLDVSALTLQSNWYIGAGDSNFAFFDGIIDEFRVYTPMTGGLDTLAAGGNTSDSDEYLASDGSDYTLDFEADDTDNRGEYLFMGTDAQFQGLNTDLATLGVDGTAANIQWEYWNGSGWSSLTVTEQTTGASTFEANGNFYWTAPGNWLPYSVNGPPDLYYLRAHLESGNYTTSPVENLIKTDILLFNYLSNTTAEDRTFAINTTGKDTDSGGPPVAHWPMDEGYGTTVNDRAEDHHLTLSGSSWIHSDSSYSSHTSYLQFDGSDDYLSDAYDPDFDFDGTGDALNSFTITGWFRHPSTITSTDMLLARHDDAGYKIYINSSGNLCFAVDTDSAWGSSNYDSACTTTSYADSRWYHFSAVKNSTTSILLYINGHQVASDTNLAALGSLNSVSTLYIGVDSDGTSNPWDGFLDNITVYHYARTAAQVKADYIGTPQTAAHFGSETKDTLTHGLVGWWKMDESSGDAPDSSGNNLTLTNNNTATFSGAKFGNGTELNGTTQYFDGTDNSTLSITSDLTLAAWINPDDTTGTQDIIGKWDGANESYLLALNGTSVVMYIDSSSNYQSTTATTISANTLTHIASVYNSQKQTVQLYVNGELQSSSTTGTLPSSIGDDTGEFAIGVEDTSGTPTNYFDGHIDDVRVYNRALQPREVRQLYNYGPPPVAYYSFDENTGVPADTDEVKDHSGNANHGEMESSMTESDWVPGKYGSALDFDGGDDYINIPHSNSINISNDQITLSAWIKPSVTTATVIIGKPHTSSHTDPYFKYTLYYDGDVQPRQIQSRLDSTILRSGSGNTCPQNSWCYVVGTYDGSTMRVYIDGVEKNSTPKTGNIQTSSEDLLIGQNVDDGENLDGLIDEVKIYNYARTQAQIIQDMNAGHPIGGSPVGSQVGYWKFDEGYGDTANDSSPQNNDGDLAGACPGATTCPTWSNNGKFNKALDFDGANDYVDTGTQIQSLISGDGSVSWWMYPHDAFNDGAIHGFWGASTSGLPPEISAQKFSDDQLYIGWNASGDDDRVIIAASSSNYPQNQWSYYTLTWESGGTSRLYHNGIEIGSNNGGTTPNSPASTFRIGRQGDVAQYFDGLIDEFKIYNTALTPDQILIDYNKGKAAVLGSTGEDASGNKSYSSSQSYCPPGNTCNPPVGHWKLDEYADNTCSATEDACDTSGNENHGTQSGGPVWQPITHCHSGSCLDFDGNDDYINFGSAIILDDLHSSSFTASAWIYPRTLGQNNSGSIFDKASLEDTGWRLRLNTSNQLYYRINFSTTDIEVFANNLINLNQWQYVTLRYNSSTQIAEAFINGVLRSTSSAGSGTADTDASSSLLVGVLGYAGASNFDGPIDEVRIYNYARTPAQIAWDYNRGAPIAWWKLDECTGTTAYDSSPNSALQNGTITIGTSGSNTTAGTCSSGVSTEAWNNGTTGKRGASLDFDGTDDYITVTNTTEIDLNDALESGFSVSAWTYANSAGENNTGEIFDKGTNTYCRTDNQSGSSLDLQCQIDLATSNSLNLSSALTTNTWQHIILVWENDADDEFNIYINGINRGTSTGNSGDPNADANNLLIGGDSSNNFDGQIDDVKIFNYALTDEQIKLEYNQGSSVRFGP